MTVETTMPILPQGRERKRPANFLIEPSIWAEFGANARAEGKYIGEQLRELIEDFNRRCARERRARGDQEEGPRP